MAKNFWGLRWRSRSPVFRAAITWPALPPRAWRFPDGRDAEGCVCVVVAALVQTANPSCPMQLDAACRTRGLAQYERTMRAGLPRSCFQLFMAFARSELGRHELGSQPFLGHPLYFLQRFGGLRRRRRFALTNLGKSWTTRPFLSCAAVRFG